MDGGHSETPGRAGDTLPGCEEGPPAYSGVQSWIAANQPVGAPAVPMLGASTVAHTSRGSPSITALLPDEGVVLADVDSVRNGRSKRFTISCFIFFSNKAVILSWPELFLFFSESMHFTMSCLSVGAMP